MVREMYHEYTNGLPSTTSEDPEMVRGSPITWSVSHLFGVWSKVVPSLESRRPDLASLRQVQSNWDSLQEGPL